MNQPNSAGLLLVEDNSQDLEMTMRALRQANVRNSIQVARDGAEALEYLFCEGAFANREIADIPDLVLLDLKLPKVDGIEVLRRIKEDPRTRMIPVVMLTSSKEQSDVAETYQLGVNSFIVKPVDFEGFLEAVRTLGLYWLLLNHPPK
jgi:CheY-like chemotaxis protein